MIDKFEVLKLAFDTIKQLTDFIKNNEDVCVPFAKYEKLEQLSSFVIREDTRSIVVPNVWHYGESEFVQSYL